MNVDRLIKLTELTGVSGYERTVTSFLEKELLKLDFSCKIDEFGNVIAHRFGKGKRILLEAHIDQVGMMVSKVSDDGFLRFSPVGGLDMRVLPSQEVVVHADKPIKGVICFHPSRDSENKSKVPDLKRLCIDTGLGKNAQDIVSVGDIVSFATKPFEQNGHLFGCALDNRASIEIILSLLSEIEPSADITVLFAVQEEVGHFGALVASCFCNIDLAIVLDVTFGRSHEDAETFVCGKGPAIGVGPSVSRIEAQRMCHIAAKRCIPHQVEVMGGSSGTDAWVIQLLGEGIPTVMLSVPLRYMHTPMEQVALSDLENSITLLAAFIEEVRQND